MMTMDLDKVPGVDLSYAREYVTDQHYEWLTADKEHYRLLAFLSYQFKNSVLYDIGSYRGLSAVALAANPVNKVISYDITDYIEVKAPSNVEFKIGNCVEDAGIAKSPLICLDVDPHDGKFELLFMQWLALVGFKGLVVLDDIHLNQSMKDFWHSIQQEKHDITDVGHHSGTGLVVF